MFLLNDDLASAESYVECTLKLMPIQGKTGGNTSVFYLNELNKRAVYQRLCLHLSPTKE